jgi:transaldolase
LWKSNQEFWATRPTPLRQEIVFASTGTKKPEDPPWKYVVALAGSDIQTNPPGTNEAVRQSGLTFHRSVGDLPPEAVLIDIEAKVNWQQMEDTLMREGVVKFAEPQKSLLKLLGEKRGSLLAQRA